MTTTSFVLTSYNIHKGMSPLNRQVKMQGIAQALESVGSDVLCLQEVQGQNLKRNMQYNEYPDQSQHEWFGEFLDLQNSYGTFAATYRCTRNGIDIWTVFTIEFPPFRDFTIPFAVFSLNIKCFFIFAFWI